MDIGLILTIIIICVVVILLIGICLGLWCCNNYDNYDKYKQFNNEEIEV